MCHFFIQDRKRKLRQNKEKIEAELHRKTLTIKPQELENFQKQIKNIIEEIRKVEEEEQEISNQIKQLDQEKKNVLHPEIIKRYHLYQQAKSFIESYEKNRRFYDKIEEWKNLIQIHHWETEILYSDNSWDGQMNIFGIRLKTETSSIEIKKQSYSLNREDENYSYWNDDANHLFDYLSIHAKGEDVLELWEHMMATVTYHEYKGKKYVLSLILPTDHGEVMVRSGHQTFSSLFEDVHIELPKYKEDICIIPK